MSGDLVDVPDASHTQLQPSYEEMSALVVIKNDVANAGSISASKPPSNIMSSFPGPLYELIISVYTRWQ